MAKHPTVKVSHRCKPHGGVIGKVSESSKSAEKNLSHCTRNRRFFAAKWGEETEDSGNSTLFIKCNIWMK